MNLEKDQSHSIRVTVNGEEVPLNPFVNNFMIHTIEAMVSALKDIPTPAKSITIQIDKK